MLSHTVVLRNIDPKQLHQQIIQLESVQQEMDAEHDDKADRLRQAVRFLHMIEDEMRRQVRIMHAH